MKANEIQIGDYLRRRYTCADTGREVVIDFQLTEIRKNGDSLYVCSEKGVVCKVEDAEPIPLTPEILEKNGFESVRGIMTFMDEYYDIQIEDWSDSIFRIRVDFCEMNTPHFQATISYAHELQHCLRLCGIDKEIILNFKED